MRLTTVAMLLWSSLAWAGDQPANPSPSWWLAGKLRVVTYEFLERQHRDTDLSADQILNYVDRLGGCDLVLIKGFHYWKGQFDDSTWGYPRFRRLAETLIPKLHARRIKAGIFGFTDRQRSYANGPDHSRIMDVWKDYVRLGADILFVDEESGSGGLDIPASCLTHCDELRSTFALPVGLFLYGSASQASQVRAIAPHVDVLGEMSYNLFLEAHGDFGLEDVTRQWTDELKNLANHPVAYWTGAMVITEQSRAPGSFFWRERFGERTLAGYFEAYPRKALTSGANGVFFHSLCRLDGLPSKTRDEVTAAMNQVFKEMTGRLEAVEFDGSNQQHEVRKEQLGVHKLSKAEAAEVAARLANQECERLYRKRPFKPEQQPAVLRAGKYQWGGLDVGGPGGFSAWVTFDEDGSHPKVEIYLSRDFPPPFRIRR